MRTLCLALLLSVTGQAANAIPIINIATFPFPRDVRYSYGQSVNESTNFSVGPGGATVNIDFQVDYPTINLDVPGFPEEAEAIVFVNSLDGDEICSYTDTDNFVIGETSCANVALQPEIYLVFSGLSISVPLLDSGNPATVTGFVNGLVTMNIDVLSGTVNGQGAVPEPRTWLLAGSGLLATFASVRRRIRL